MNFQCYVSRSMNTHKVTSSTSQQSEAQVVHFQARLMSRQHPMSAAHSYYAPPSITFLSMHSQQFYSAVGIGRVERHRAAASGQAWPDWDRHSHGRRP